MQITTINVLFLENHSLLILKHKASAADLIMYWQWNIVFILDHCLMISKQGFNSRLNNVTAVKYCIYFRSLSDDFKTQGFNSILNNLMGVKYCIYFRCDKNFFAFWTSFTGKKLLWRTTLPVSATTFSAMWKCWFMCLMLKVESWRKICITTSHVLRLFYRILLMLKSFALFTKWTLYKMTSENWYECV